jgi:hypothetical protein
VKRRSFVGFRFGPDTTAVFSNDALYRGKSYAGALKLLVGVGAVEMLQRACPHTWDQIPRRCRGKGI